MKLKKSSKLYDLALKEIETLSADDNIWFESLSLADKNEVLAMFACSQFIKNTCQTHAGLLPSFFEQNPDSHQYASRLQSQLDGITTELELHQCIRRFRNSEMAKITARDITKSQTIETSLQHVSKLADSLIMSTYMWLYQFCCQKYGTPQNGQPMCIIAMGKLGGEELNFSSDIDLIFAYPEKGETQGHRKPIEHQVFFTRLAQRLIKALDQITTDGQVYRVDMRLRPFGDSGPLVTHFDAFSDYYHEQAREWERFAMVKARVLNPSCSAVTELENIIRPFVYKRYLDFTTLDALQSMKLKIFADSRRRQLSNNIKLGEGGIREAEFFIQSFQLTHGGQSANLQIKNWKSVVSHLLEQGFIDEKTSSDLTQSYLFLREVEHCLQQINNEQTQTLPALDDELNWQRLALYTQSESSEIVQNKIETARQTIHGYFNELFVDESSTGANQDDSFTQLSTLWLGDYDEIELSGALQDYLCDDSAGYIARALLSFKQKCVRAHLSQRAQSLIDKLIPLLITEALKPPTCDHIPLERMLLILTAILGRTTYLDLLYAYPSVRQQLLVFCVASPWIAEQLKQFPLLLDELLSQAYLSHSSATLEDVKAEFKDELRQVLLRMDLNNVELHMDALRQFKLCQQFRIAAADIQGSLPIEQVSDRLTALAEVILSHVVETAYSHMTKKYGAPNHCNSPIDSFAVIAYGKMGGLELGYGSDLDMVFLHDAPSTAVTDGEKSIGAQQFYIKMAQRIMHILNTKMLLGELYEADLRLRPSGNSGLLCCHVDGYAYYQDNDAWTWEHQALVRTRVVFGGTSISQRINTIKTEVLCRKRDIADLTEKVVDMRKKLYENSINKSSKDIFKHGKGGITDIEFISQFIVLAYAYKLNRLADWPDNLRIIETAMKEKLISAEIATSLSRNYLNQRNAFHRMTLQQSDFNTNLHSKDKARADIENAWRTILPSYIPDE
ncbi:bifunctional [glutamate--ammonia ligase]-adenylyl-L-tyrosine phosphorylase/[glutamate--ammonia-ligase] adenylyltransferase [Alteromonas sp. 5E99-2]|uniref:bifunctional [glutamate--ammonia ligase]-adenylyl-L-tyrosine phosphorylase/[glutamate--ammonia-ligase] adenylyltransferase n=1 Tax=Alteromonas sp. 5E99-2 TaxID=2817683 RepID=UPI001A99F39E|nr:bifunctional [glutamate--ammonia ligase]-adenylyl-L-tyrosine phosphorylase/[glutamate--ammonia-ligase] adenylyltransferase [Alteromonas sp. 5E99-2]